MNESGPHPCPSGERMIYLVPSDRKKAVRYRVDLLANHGAGECSCTDWATRRNAGIKQGLEWGTTATACKHVLKARRFFLNGLLQNMARGEVEFGNGR